MAEIQADGDCVAVLSQEAGEITIEFDNTWVWAKGRKIIPLSDIKIAIERAERSLLRMRKE